MITCYCINPNPLKQADDTAVVGLIRDNNEDAYRGEVKHQVKWCSSNNLILNVSKTKEMVLDFRRNRHHHTPLHINNSTVVKVSSTKFLGVQITEDLTWSQNTAALVKKGHQRLHFLHRLRRAHLPFPILTMLYSGTIESVLTSCISIWAAGCKVSDWKALQRVVRTTENIIGTSLPLVQDIAQKHCDQGNEDIHRSFSPTKWTVQAACLRQEKI